MSDTRRSHLATWAAAQTGVSRIQLQPASIDAGSRRYFRLRGRDGSLIAVDAPPAHENTAAFVEIAAMIRQAGVHAPRVIAHDTPRGFLLLENLGTQTFLDVLDGENADALYSAAIAALIRMQSAIDARALPDFDQKLLRAELKLFIDWYLQRHAGVELSASERRLIESVFTLLEASALEQPAVFVHRDYMPRNLMCSDPNPGVIDFQDAVRGPVSYDIICLLKDAFISWPATRVDEWLESYWVQAQAACIHVPDDWNQFKRAVDLMGIQRHLKVIGIFARLCYRDGKCRYQQDSARFFSYIFDAAASYPELDEFVVQLRHWQVAAGAMTE